MTEPLTVRKLREAHLDIVYAGRTGEGVRTALTYCRQYPDIGHYLVTDSNGEKTVVVEASYTFGGSKEHFHEAKDLDRFVAEYNAWHDELAKRDHKAEQAA